MKIGILQCGHALDEVKAGHGDYAAMFRRLLDGNGFSFEAWDVVDMQFPADVDAADGWLLTGSKHGVYDPLPFIAPLEAFVRKAYAADIPLVGICFGHQLIAQALGGKVEKYSGGWSVGRQVYDFDGVGPVALNAWHQDQVTALPPDAVPVASSGFCRNAALVYRRRAFTVQAHPEFPDGVISDLVRLRRGAAGLPDALLDAAAEDLAGPPDSAPVARRIADFFLEHAGHGAEASHG